MQNREQLISHDYRALLKAELNSRCKHNPCYSLRAFARDLKIAPSRLSEILNHKQGLSRTFAEKIAVMMGLTPDEQDFFCDSVTAFHARSQQERRLAKDRLMERFYHRMVAS